MICIKPIAAEYTNPGKVHNQHNPMFKKIILSVVLSTACSIIAFAQQPTEKTGIPAVAHSSGSTVSPAGSLEADSVMVTVILKHQQNKNLPEIRRILEAQGFWDIFPPSDVRVVSWTLAMGLGHVIILKCPPGAVRRLNLAIENGAWGAFDSEIYLTYDYQSIWEDTVEKRAEAKEDRN